MPRESQTGKKKYTAKAFADAYIELKETAPQKHITIQMLCEHTGLNRTTFYRYYEDLRDLEESLTEEYFSKLFSPMKAFTFYTPSAGNPRELILQQLKISQKYLKLARLIITREQLPAVRLLMEHQMTLFLDSVNGSMAPKKMVPVLYSYFCGGMASLWVEYIQNDYSDEDLSDLANLILCLINNFYEMVHMKYGADMENRLVAEMMRHHPI